jgi:tetratricopeptide (TPR) repeat protein
VARDEVEKKSEKKSDELVAECDLLIKAGKISSVISLISRLNLAQVPRSSCQSLAKICRRVGMVSQGLRLLQPIIRHQKEQIKIATAGEICEYSVLLSRNGSIQEALNLLTGVNARETPEASLYLAYCHISNWDYSKAIGLLQGFLNSDADSYSKLIARVNLISAHLAVSQLDEAFDLLAETIPMAEQSDASRLVGNCLELRGRVHLHRGDFSNSRMDLNQALEIFGTSQSYDRLFIHKWQAVISAFEESSVEPLIRFRQEALLGKQWESVREADLFTIKIQFDQKLLDHLTYGTPMASYRQRIHTEVGGNPSEAYLFGNAGPCLDLTTGKINGIQDFNPGKKIHQVIAALIKDFYVPRNMGTLFSELYPNEYFDINSSPLRVRQLLRRTRQWLSENGLPASIEQKKGSYKFLIHGSFGIRIQLESPAILSSSVHWQQLKAVFSMGSPFTAKQACEKLNWPRSSFLLLAEWALATGELLKSGTGRSTVYHIANLSPSKTVKSVA